MKDQRPRAGRPSPWWVWLVVLAAGAVGCGLGPSRAPDGFALPSSHEVASLAKEMPGFDQFRKAATEEGLGLFCATGGWQICLVQVDETLVVIPFDNPGGTQVRITGDGLAREMVVPAEGREPYGVEHTGGRVKVTVEDPYGNWLGEMEGAVTES